MKDVFNKRQRAFHLENIALGFVRVLLERHSLLQELNPHQRMGSPASESLGTTNTSSLLIDEAAQQ